MYLYFNNRGVLKEIINDKPLRQGEQGNDIFIYIEGFSDYTNIHVMFEFSNSVHHPFGTAELDKSEYELKNKTIPYDSKRDLKYFKYGEKYTLLQIPTTFELHDIMYNALEVAGLVQLSVFLIGGALPNIIYLGMITFNVEETTTGDYEIQAREWIDIAQWNYLCGILKDIRESTNTNIDKLIAVVDGEITPSNFEVGQIVLNNNQLYIITESDNVKSASPFGLVLPDYQEKLISGTNIKTINGESLLGSGNIVISGGGSGAWGTIEGNIEDQTDLQAEFQNVREVAEGKCQAFILSYKVTKIESGKIYYINNNNEEVSYTLISHFYIYNSETKEWEDKKSDLTSGSYDNIVLRNSALNTTDLYVNMSGGQSANSTYLLLGKAATSLPTFWLLNVYKAPSDVNVLSQYTINKGDIFYIYDIDVSDWWWDGSQLCALETTKVDLTNYGNLTENETVTGTWTFEDSIKIKDTTNNKYLTIESPVSNAEVAFNYNNTNYILFNQSESAVKTINVIPMGNSGTRDLGSSSQKWKDLYLSGSISDGTNSLTIADIATTNMIPDVSKIGYEVLSSHTQFSALTGGELYPCIGKGAYIPTFATFNGNQRQNIFIQFTNISGNNYKVQGWFMDTSRNSYIFEGQINGISDGSTSNVSYSNFTEIKLTDVAARTALYQHNISIYETDTPESEEIHLTVISSHSTAYTASDLNAYLVNKGTFVATGFVLLNGNLEQVMSLYTTSSSSITLTVGEQYIAETINIINDASIQWSVDDTFFILS